MQCDSLSAYLSLGPNDRQQYQPQWNEDMDPDERAAFYQGYADGVVYEQDDDVEHDPADQPVCAMYKKGKGKGKGQGRQMWSTKGGGGAGGKGNYQNSQSQAQGVSGKGLGGSTASTGKGQREKRVCNWCHIQGHIERDCQKKARGEAQKQGARPQPRDLKSLEMDSADWEVSLGGLAMDCGSLELDLCPLEAESVAAK